MLPESKFPVTGGIMQTEEVVPRAQSVTLEDSTANRSVTFQPVLRFEQHIQYPIPSLINMAVKQEPQEEEEHEREAIKLRCPENSHYWHSSFVLFPFKALFRIHSADIEAVQIPDAPLNNKRGSSDQSSPDCDSRSVAPVAQQNEGKKSNSRARRKSRWKLKFHHQALPPEYLDHYEAALAQEAALSSTAASALSAPPATTVLTAAASSADSRLSSPASMAPTAPVPVGAFTSTSHPIVDVQSWLHRLAAMQNDVYPPRQVAAGSMGLQPATSLRRSVITSTQSTPQMSQATHQSYLHAGGGGAHAHRNNAHPQASQPSPRAPMKYSDLPYMGEITLDNSKPRRGRKPKKADICHLIYKNYGTILPGTPGLEDKLKGPSAMRDKIELKEAQVPVAFQRTDIQNRISSLLEKRLTQERRAFDVAAMESAREQDEPLNLCIRDLNLLKLRFAERQSGSFESCHSKSEGSSETDDAVNLQEVSQSRQPSLELLNGLDFNSKRLEDQDNPVVDIVANIDVNGSQARPFNSESNEMNGGAGEANSTHNESEVKKNPGLLYWPNTALFIHPAALQSQFLYYKKLAEEKGTEEEGAKKAGVPYNALEAAKVHPQIASPVDQARAPAAPSSRAKRKQEPPGALCLPKASGASAGVSGQPGATSQGQLLSSGGGQPMKRKRSAIFIPPMPSENNNNPATEVSICKFKFTGGAKPSLQEKKSLSVDSGGNFRYYSGTGDKSMRGYEFFPREALQQPAHQAGGSSSGAFLNAAAERISPAQVGCSPRGCSVQEDSRRKRKSRKSIQREKLEQTFKEKGFLIQTQQLESAEGATYCKFRQLRKFTRYLFRSWKDYLPGNVRELTVDANSDSSLVNLKEPDADAECLPGSPLASGNLELEQTFTDNSPAASLSLN